MNYIHLSAVISLSLLTVFAYLTLHWSRLEWFWITDPDPEERTPTPERNRWIRGQSGFIDVSLMYHDLSDLESLIQIQITPFERTLYVYICTQIIFAYQQSNWRIRFSFKSRMRLFQTILTENRSKLS